MLHNCNWVAERSRAYNARMGLSNRLASLFFRHTKWDLVVDEELPTEGAILIGAPHTSNWDFPLMLAMGGGMGVKFRFLAKNSLFWWPLGPIMRAFGGIPVDRGTSSGMVEEMARKLKNEPGAILALTPKGTRKKRDYWRSGFYRIAQESGLPLLLASVDSKTHTLHVGPTLHPTGDMRADMDKIREFYAGKVGIRPELTSEPRLRGEED